LSTIKIIYFFEAYPLREIPVGRLWWGYISTMLHLYIERAASILPAEDIYMASRGEVESSLKSKSFSLPDKFPDWKRMVRNTFIGIFLTIRKRIRRITSN